RAIQVYDVQPARAFRFPAVRYLYGIVAISRYRIEASLQQPHALAILEINGGIEVHVTLFQLTRCGNLIFLSADGLKIENFQTLLLSPMTQSFAESAVRPRRFFPGGTGWRRGCRARWRSRTPRRSRWSPRSPPRPAAPDSRSGRS